MYLSIVIPAFNEEEYLGATLAGVERAFGDSKCGDSDWEVIVCNNNSTDGTAGVAKDRGAEVVFEPHNLIAKARNTGAAHAGGEWLVFLDADTYPPPGLITEMLEAIGTGTCIGGGSTVSVQGGSLFNKLRLERLNPLFRLFKCCGGAFLFCRRDAFEALEGFCTDLYALEDIEFVLRLKRFGRARGKRFLVLHRHPVVTSGRKAGSVVEIAKVIVADFVATFLFMLHCMLPKTCRPKLGGRRLLGYWYRGRR